MAERSKPASIHGLGEAYLYARVTPCAVCAGPLDAENADFAHDTDSRVLTLKTSCRLCDAQLEKDFSTAEVEASDFDLLADGRLAPPWEAGSPTLNLTPDASRVIDVAGWLTLSAMVSEEARRAGGEAGSFEARCAARRIRLVAAACLEEALKFFEDDNDLPPDDAFFRDDTRRQFWERPELFTRQYIADLRLSAMKAAPER
jgi:hypothetical protein